MIVIERDMAKIIVIGCPGSGKSTTTFKLQEKLQCPVLHLDKIYHIDNERHISRDELMKQVEEFANAHDHWIIDGNYISSVEQRVKMADTVILLDIDANTCIENAIARTKKDRSADMAEGFDNTKIQDGFLEYIASFKKDSLPRIMEVLSGYKDEKTIIILKNYDEIENFLKDFDSSSENEDN